MDSLTQITLGAAVGEVVLGRKIGNRAMLWGAVGGTIPDLDILANLWMNEIDALAAHRGLSHSILFAAVTPWVFGWLVERFYQSGLYRKSGVKWMFFLIWSMALLGISVGLVALTRQAAWPVVAGVAVLALGGTAWWVRHWWRGYLQRELGPVQANYRDWVRLFFWAIFTHPLLDAFTSYGTQLFVPFSDYRVAFNVIAIVDPIYTVPFLGAVILASWLPRDVRLRRRVNHFGLVWSTMYLLLCTGNKLAMDRIFARSAAQQGIPLQRFTTSPTIFNNLLWQGTLETEDTYYLGSFSLLDQEWSVQDFTPVPRRQTVPDAAPDDHTLSILRWFSNGYYTILEKPDGSLHFHDLRYGALGGDEPIQERMIFSFVLTPGPDGWEAHQQRPEDRDMGRDFQNLWRRMLGKDYLAENR